MAGIMKLKLSVFMKYLTTQVVLLLVFADLSASIDQLVYTFTNQVGAGNFSYFKLHRDGVVRLELKSTLGDVDLYVSSRTLSPDYINYEFSSATCGDDVITIPPEMARPVGVGVYGHPSYEVSHFVLSVYFVYTDENFELLTDGDTAQASPGSLNSVPADNEQQESLLWSIFVGLLKIILDILV